MQKMNFKEIDDLIKQVKKIKTGKETVLLIKALNSWLPLEKSIRNAIARIERKAKSQGADAKILREMTDLKVQLKTKLTSFGKFRFYKNEILVDKLRKDFLFQMCLLRKQFCPCLSC